MGKNIYQTIHTVTPKIFDFIKNQKNAKAIKHLEQQPEEINLKGWRDDTPLHVASEYGNVELVRYLLDHGAAVNALRSSVYETTPLCWAKTGEIAALLLDAGATLHPRALEMATREDRPTVIDELLARGAEINQASPQFMYCQSDQALKVYLDHGVDVSSMNKNGGPIVHPQV